MKPLRWWQRCAGGSRFYLFHRWRFECYATHEGFLTMWRCSRCGKEKGERLERHDGACPWRWRS